VHALPAAAARSLLLATLLTLLPVALAPRPGAPKAALTSSDSAAAGPDLALQPMSDHPGLQALQSDGDASILLPAQPAELVPKLRPLPDPDLTLFEPAGCQAPPDDYSPVQAGPRMLSARTLAMLEHAARLYDGRLDIAGEAILPSPRGSVEQVGPDPGGEYGVVDLAVVGPAGRVLYEEIDPLIRALRAAGFAAWLRDRAELSPKSEAYIHAVAIGDRQLSDEATAQLNGPDGYFRGGRGLSGERLNPDPHGGPVLCRWMAEAMSTDLRVGGLNGRPAPTELRWELRLEAVAATFITEDPQATAALARRLGYLSSGQEDPSNMCGPLSAAILQEAGLLPATVGPVANLKNYWLANPATNGRPWSLFPRDQYVVYHFATGTDRFDFAEWPLMPGDFVYTYSGRGSFSHMFVVTEVDAAGRAYTVTNQLQPDAGYLVQRVMLYDPREHEAGVLHSPCVECGSWRRRTGLGGFDVLRRRELDQAPGTELLHQVLPGETLPAIAGAYGSTLAAVAELNEVDDPLSLQVGAELVVPINLPLQGPSDSAMRTASASGRPDSSR
jgi:hypothetical protein